MAEKNSETYEKMRYARDRRKRIAAERKWQENNAEYKAKHALRGKAQDKGKLPPDSAKCPHCSKTGGRKERHHLGAYKSQKTEIRCSLCNPRGGAAAGAKRK